MMGAATEIAPQNDSLDRPDPNMINKQWTVRSVVLRHPHLMRRLVELGIGPGHAYLTLEAVAVRLGLQPDALVDDLSRAATA
jgi:hypothetical protein